MPHEIIDAWAQHPTLRHISDPIFASLRRWTRSETPTAELPVSLTTALMDEASVGRALISAWVAPRNVMISNDEVASFVAQAPDRLIGVGSVDVAKPMSAVREIRRCVNELGFKAIRVLPWLWEAPPTDRRFYPVYTACCDLGVPFCTQIGHTGPLMPSEVGRPIYLDQVLIDFPELVVVGGHIGYPWTDEAIAIADKHPSFFIDTSAYAARRYPAALVEYLRGRGRTRVLFGTNYPMLTPGQRSPVSTRSGSTTRRPCSSSPATRGACSRSTDVASRASPRAHAVVLRLVLQLGEAERFQQRRHVDAEAAAKPLLEAVPAADGILRRAAP